MFPKILFSRLYEKNFARARSLGIITTPKNYAHKFSYLAKKAKFRFSLTRRIFWYAKTKFLDEKHFFFPLNIKNRFFRGSILIFLVPIDIELSYTYQTLLVDSAFQALSNDVSIDR